MKPSPISLLVCALGGEGGGVLTEWLVDTARHAGYAAQATSIPGVAQRTGATTYYIEVFALPTPGMDVLCAAWPARRADSISHSVSTPPPSPPRAQTSSVMGLGLSLIGTDSRGLKRTHDRAAQAMHQPLVPPRVLHDLGAVERRA